MLSAILKYRVRIFGGKLLNFVGRFSYLNPKLHSCFFVSFLPHDPFSQHLLLELVCLLEVATHVCDFLHRAGKQLSMHLHLLLTLTKLILKSLHTETQNISHPSCIFIHASTMFSI
ncbi:hypothetical protein CD932_27845 [Janthinobacterium sp. PC23-8]|nr:hypothetical protein CD932_27845 [Janthinobacterium sp. PC23-8]